MGKNQSIIGGVLFGLFSLVPEAGRQITGGKSKKGGSGGGSSTHYHIHNKIGNSYHHKTEVIKKQDVHKFITNHFHKK